MPFYERQPYIQPLHALVSEVMQGDIRVPRFQRPGTEVTWYPEKRGDLLDSIYRGFPVGTILLWSTAENIKTLAQVGGFSLPPSENSTAPKRLLLDGHQRLSTLVQILGPGLISDADVGGGDTSREEFSEPPETWAFELEASKETEKSEETEKTRDRFVLLARGQNPSSTQLPLSIVLNRQKLNRWIRDNELSDAQTLIADGVRDRLREYAMPVAVLVTDSLNEATESFKRINSSGVDMGHFHMVSALAFHSGFDPREVFSEMREKHLTPIGWQDVGDLEVLRVCAGLSGMHPSTLDVDKLAKKLTNKTSLIEDAFKAIAIGAELFARVGVWGPGALPYSWQLITLSIRIRELGVQNRADRAKLEAIDRWFWLTTYGGVFAGVNSAVYTRAGEALVSMVNGGQHKSMERDMMRKIGEVTRFDWRSVRSKACALAIARHQDGGDHAGPAHHALAQGASSLQTTFSKGMRSTWWHLAVVTSKTSVKDIRETLRRRVDGCPEPSDDEMLARLSIPDDASGSIEDLLECRRQELAKKEQSFVEELGFEWEATT